MWVRTDSFLNILTGFCGLLISLLHVVEVGCVAEPHYLKTM